MTAKRDDSPETNRRRISLLFGSLVGLFCLWALSLPLFPTQDGPMHKYYVHVLGSLLSGSHDYSAYVIRHPFPPYATHYAVLLGLTRFVSYDLAEKLLICLVFVCTAYGVRYCARSLGPSGDWLSLCAIPLVLHWSLVMGFLNYSLALGLFFLAAGLWCRAASEVRLWWVFALISFLLALTHPIPLLLLIVFCWLDLVIRLLQRFSLRDYRWQFVGLAISALCFLYPLASVDRSRSASNLRGFGLHKDALISSLALFGISPFDTRAKNFLINGYRLLLCALLLTCLWLAAEGFHSRWRERKLRSSDSMLILSVAILVAIPILPASMNGSDFFSQRLMVVPWLGAIAAAGATTRRITRMVPAFAVLLTVVTLLPAEIFFRPVARQLFALEHQPLPQHAEGLAILDPAMLKQVRVQHELGFNPYLWSGVLPFLRGDDIMLNSPFMDQKITPLMPTTGGDLLIDRMKSAEQAERIINGNLDLPGMTPELRSALMSSTQILVLVGVPADIEQGLTPLVGGDLAGHYACSSHGWYLVCAARQG
ncbi:MAG TPA: hypothetical protein VMB49_09135 [Acidobacteriaceae bacterium]|nr:hypothetical protein [Acidobacteriaceae bacterium]